MDYTNFINRIKESVPSSEFNKHADTLLSINKMEQKNLVNALSWGISLTEIISMPRHLLSASYEAFEDYMFRTCVPTP